MSENTVFHHYNISRADREKQLNQRSFVFGLPGFPVQENQPLPMQLSRNFLTPVIKPIL